MLPATLPAPFSATLSPALSAYLLECGAAGSASGQTACPVHPTLCQSRSRRQRESSPPWLPVSAPPTGLDECLFFISLVSDFLDIRFSVSSGCARRRSVSTYASILVLWPSFHFLSYSSESFSIFFPDAYLLLYNTVCHDYILFLIFSLFKK